MSHDDRYTEEDYVREEVRRFKQHLLTYACVVGMLFLINFVTGGFWHGHFWFLWVAFFWGIAIAFQAARLFGDDVGREWEDRTVDRILARRRGQRPPSSYTPPAPPEPPPPSRGPQPPAA